MTPLSAVSRLWLGPSSRLNDFLGELWFWHRARLCLLSHTDVWRLLDPSAGCPETRPWEDDAYFITKGSELSVKRARLHWAVIGTQLVSKRIRSVLTNCSSGVFLSFLFSFLFSSYCDCDTSECSGTRGIFPTEDERQPVSSVNCSFFKNNGLLWIVNKANLKLQ